MKYQTTVISVSVHAEGDHAILGDTATHVRVEDEGGGPFLVLSQAADVEKTLRFDLEELDNIIIAAKKLIDDAGK